MKHAEKRGERKRESIDAKSRHARELEGQQMPPTLQNQAGGSAGGHAGGGINLGRLHLLLFQ